MLTPKYNLGNIDPDQSVTSNFLRNRRDIHCLSQIFFRNISSYTSLIISRIVPLSSIQPKAETLDFSTTHFREIF